MGPGRLGPGVKEARAESTSVPAPSPGQQPHLARAVPRVLRVSHVAEAAEQLLHQEQGDLLQDGLLQVGCGRRASSVAEGRPRAHLEATFAACSLSSRTPASRVHFRRAALVQPAGAQRREPRAPGSAPVPAQVCAPDLPSVLAVHWVSVSSLALSRVLPVSGFSSDLERLGGALRSPFLARTHSDPSRRPAAFPVRSGFEFQPYSDVIHAGVSPGLDAELGSGL